MGLDITVYPKVIPLEKHECDRDDDWDECYEAGHRRAYVYAGFEQSYRGLPVGDPPIVVTYDTRMYGNAWVTTEGDAWGFRAGSYSGYNAFRDALCRAAWGMSFDEVDYSKVDEYRGLPFFELIWFADNEGTIGPEAAADLARDYDEHKDRIEVLLDDDYLVDKFQEWGHAFHTAADTGMIDFH